MQKEKSQPVTGDSWYKFYDTAEKGGMNLQKAKEFAKGIDNPTEALDKLAKISKGKPNGQSSGTTLKGNA
jgi:hypothetical protein